MKPVALVSLCALALFAQLGPKTSQENMVRDRGQTRVEDQRETLSYGHIGTQQMMPENQLTLSGILVDASCENRSSLNLYTQPLPLADQMPAQPPNAAANNPPRQGAVSSHGITVDAQTMEREHADITPHLVPDILTRQEDPTCAITASTSSYSLLMNNGRFLNMDQGGNTLASAAILGDPRGRAMLNGLAPGLKPYIVVKGWILGDRVIVGSIQSFASPQQPRSGT
jgi:hypothetical protein